MKIFGLQIDFHASKDEYFDMRLAMGKFHSVEALGRRLDELQRIAEGGIHGLKITSPGRGMPLMIRLTIDKDSTDRAKAAFWLSKNGIPVESEVS